MSKGTWVSGAMVKEGEGMGWHRGRGQLTTNISLDHVIINPSLLFLIQSPLKVQGPS